MSIKNNKILLCVVGCITFFFISCSDYCDEIIDHSKTKFGNDFEEGEVYLKEVYDFDWDKLYIFQPLQHQSEISKTIGFDCECETVPDDTWLYLFIKKNKIVKEKYTTCANINFLDAHSGKGSYEIVSSKSKFKINRSKKNKNYYLLKSIQ